MGFRPDLRPARPAAIGIERGRAERKSADERSRPVRETTQLGEEKEERKKKENR